jgi:3-phosphoshikimate 1-carboxyvinyltransferase
MSVPLFEKVAFIGLGLIGSSLARVMIAEGLTQNIVASTRSEKNLTGCPSFGLNPTGV